MTGPRCDDRGFATVWVAGATAAILVVAATVIWFATAVGARHRATAAADLAALAAAGSARSGPAAACRSAALVAARMNARLESCELLGRDVRLVVVIEPSGWLSAFGSTQARARAGPDGRSSASDKR